jgi:hypothetical protein
MEHTTPTVLVIVQLLLDKAQVVMGFGDLGVVGPVSRLLDGQGAFEGRALRTAHLAVVLAAGLIAWLPAESSVAGIRWLLLIPPGVPPE